MIAEWKLELMGQMNLEQVFGEQRDLICRTCELIQQCYRVERPKKASLTNFNARIERIESKKAMLLDMRTDGEITKEEFLQQRKKLDEEIQKLTEERDALSHCESVDVHQPEWDRIRTALEEILDLSQPKPSPDLIRKFVSKIVPCGKSTFCWYLNLDGTNSSSLNVSVNGRKNKATVVIDDGEATRMEEVIPLKSLDTSGVMISSSLPAMQHRLL